MRHNKDLCYNLHQMCPMASSVHKGEGFQEQVGWGLVPPHFLLRNSFSKAKCPHPHAAVTSMSGQALKASASDGRRISKPISDKSSTPKPDTSRARVSRAEMGTKALLQFSHWEIRFWSNLSCDGLHTNPNPDQIKG